MENNASPLVSIVVITYNSAKYVLETLESAKAQTYQNIELIVSDDCSTDNTVEICRNWIAENSKRFVRTELITVEKNTGIAPNANRGYNAANGEWIKGIAGDDVLLPDCIRTFIDFSEQHSDKKVLFSKINIINDDSTYHDTMSEEFWENAYKTFEIYPDGRQQYVRLMNSRNFVPAATCFINKTVWSAVGGFDEDILFFEDYPLWIKLTSNGYNLTLLPVVLCNYRASADSVQLNERMSERFKTSYKLFYYKYKCRTPLYSIIAPYISQLNINRQAQIKNKFFLKLLYILSLIPRVFRKLSRITDKMFKGKF